MLPQRILVPIDFSDASTRALDWAVRLAEKFGATLHLLHVVESPHLSPGAAELWIYSDLQLLGKLEEVARRDLAKIATSEEDRVHLQRETRPGHPAVEILRYAEEKRIDVIVMGKHGRGALEHLLLGSVTDKVVRDASCPVLTVRG